MKIKSVLSVICFLVFSYQATPQKCIHTLQGHFNQISCLSFAAGNKVLGSSSWDKTVRIWNVQTGEVAKTIEAGKNILLAGAFSKDGKYFASGGWEPDIKIWETSSSDLAYTIENAVSYKTTGLAYSPDGKYLACASFDTIKIYDAVKYTLLRKMAGHTDAINAISFSADSKKIASASWDRTAKVWDVASGRLLNNLKGHLAAVYSVSFSPNGDFLLTASEDASVKLWDLSSNVPISSISKVKGACFATLSPDGKYIAIGSTDNSIKIIDYLSETHILNLTAHTKGIISLCFSPNGEYLASASLDNSIKVWDISDLRYEKCITEKLEAYSSLNAPKDEFETTDVYNKRVAEYARKKVEAKQECVKEEQLLNYEIKITQEEKNAIKYEYVTMAIKDISVYDADKQQFEIKIDTCSLVLKMPSGDAKTFKPLWQSATVKGIKITNPVKKTVEYVNVTVIHPDTRVGYPAGRHVSPSEDKGLKEFMEKSGNK